MHNLEVDYYLFNFLMSDIIYFSEQTDKINFFN